MSANRRNRTSSDEHLIAGIRKHIGKSAPLLLAGEKLSVAELTALLQSRIDTARAIVPVLAAWRLAVQADRKRVEQTQHVVNALRQYVAAMYGASLDVLADFGLAPYKRRQLTSAEQAERAAKAKATREARRTLGKRQKERITGATAPADPSGASPPPVAPAGGS
jgi:hypothetical protein